MASDSAVVIPLEMVHYGVTKTALLGVSHGYAKAMAGTGVTVNTVPQAIAYLSSDHASATTGGALRVDGGYVDHILP
jgi:NAD(P)-dependent dehydrogenase (short-subunit alcohol dehydrogenase family)